MVKSEISCKWVGLIGVYIRFFCCSKSLNYNGWSRWNRWRIEGRMHLLYAIKSIVCFMSYYSMECVFLTLVNMGVKEIIYKLSVCCGVVPWQQRRKFSGRAVEDLIPNFSSVVICVILRRHGIMLRLCSTVPCWVQPGRLPWLLKAPLYSCAVGSRICFLAKDQIGRQHNGAVRSLDAAVLKRQIWSALVSAHVCVCVCVCHISSLLLTFVITLGMWFAMRQISLFFCWGFAHFQGHTVRTHRRLSGDFSVRQKHHVGGLLSATTPLLISVDCGQLVTCCQQLLMWNAH